MQHRTTDHARTRRARRTSGVESVAARARACAVALALAGIAAAPSALAAGKSVDEATAAEKAEASNVYTAAMADFEHDAFEKALGGFRDSYGIVKSPNSHFMIARTLAKLGRNAEAYAELEAVIVEASALGGRYTDTETAARAKREEIRPRVGLLTVNVVGAPKGSRVMVGDEELAADRVGKQVAVLPGETKVTVVTPKGKRVTATVNIPAGSAETTALDATDAASGGPAAQEPSYAPATRVEAEAHAVGEVLDPGHGVTRGAGAGVRGTLELAHRGLLGSLDSFGVGVGADWIGSSNKVHFWVPAVVQWNLWITREVSFIVEPGAALMLGPETRVAPALSVGVRVRIVPRLYATGKLGIPGATLGLSYFL